MKHFNLRNGLHAVNLGGLLAVMQSDLPPKLKWGTVIGQFLLGQFMPSAFGVGHKLAFGTEQEAGKVPMDKRLGIGAIILAMVGLMFMAAPSAVADELRTGVGVSNLNGDGPDEDADSTFGAYRHQLDEGGHFHLATQLEMVDDFDASDSLKAYCVDVTLEGEFNPDGLVSGFLGAGIGGVFAQGATDVDTVDVVIPGDDISQGKLVFPPEVVEVQIVDEDETPSYLKADALAGIQLRFGPQRRWGVGCMGVYARPLNTDLGVDSSLTYGCFMIAPVGGGG